MGESQFYDRNNVQSWENIINKGLTRKLFPVDDIYYINNEFVNNNLYDQNKNYQFITTLNSGSASLLKVKLSAPFDTSKFVDDLVFTENSQLEFYTYANPISTEESVNIINLGALNLFTSSYITESSIKEIDFLINGFRQYRDLTKPEDDPDQPNGWCYEISNQLGNYNYYFSPTTTIGTKYSLLGSGLNNENDIPYIATLINYDYFNLDFNLVKIGNQNDSLNLYLVNQKDLGKEITTWNNIESLTQSGTFSKTNLTGINIDGTKNYLVFSPDTTINSIYFSLSNINIVGGYNPLNNLQVLPATSSTGLDIKIDDSVFNFTFPTVDLASKVGNGYFKAGVWENGVWNNGWRDDVNCRDFDSINQSILYAFDTSWRIKINGPTQSCSLFKVGDKVAIGNIIAIDINEERKLLKDFYTITDIDKEKNWIEFSLITTFPYRRIEQDSPNHKIKITKNVWLSGAFFNGYFSGVWNFGLFKGYPKITEMFNTHWIDGFFNGGHFNSNYPTFYFSEINSTQNCKDSNITLVFGAVSTPRTTGHNLLPGDYIIIEKDVNYINSNGVVIPELYNPDYNGIAKVLSVSGNNVVINKQYKPVFETETGKVTRYTASAVIQNFKFYDTNRSLLKSNESLISSSIFSFNSWIDTNYDITRAVTLGRDFRFFEKITGKSVNKTNLYGYPTYDILSSASRFRNSFDLNYGLYKLGTKYKLFTDFIGSSSEFNEPFNPQLLNNFYDAGWTFSSNNSSDLAFNRSEAVISADSASIISTTIQNYIDAGVTGNELYLTATNSGAILNSNKVNISQKRYSAVEFDVVTYSVTDFKFIQKNQQPFNIDSSSSDVFDPPATASNSSQVTNSFTASNIFSFNSQTMEPNDDFLDGFNGEVWSVDKQSDGKIIVAGNFTQYRNTVTPKPKICRLNTNLTIDTNFAPQFTQTDRNANIKFIKVKVVKTTDLKDSIFVIINYFAAFVPVIPTDLASQQVLSIVRKFNIDATNSTYDKLEQLEFNSFVTDIAFRPIKSERSDWFLTVVGDFTGFYRQRTASRSDLVKVNKIAIFSYRGSIYEVFDNPTTGGFASSDIPSTVVVDSNSEIIVGGTINTFKYSTNKTTTKTLFINGIIKLEMIEDSSVYDSTTRSFIETYRIIDKGITVWIGTGYGFDEPSTPSTLSNSSKNFINRIVVDSSDKIYVVGNFKSYNDGTLRTCNNIVRLNSNGLFDTSFNQNAAGLNNFAYDLDFNTNYSNLYVVGDFTKYNNLDCGKVISINTSNGTLLKTYTNGTLNPSPAKVSTVVLNNDNLIIGGLFASYSQAPTVSTKTITTSKCNFGEDLKSVDIINLYVKISLDCKNLDDILINLKSPDGQVINLKNIIPNNTLPNSLTINNKLLNTVFDISSKFALSNGTSPYTGTFSMEKLNNLGSIDFGISNSQNIEELIINSTQGDWTLFIQNEKADYPENIDWQLNIEYKDYLSDASIDTPSVSLPILHFNNLNFEIGYQVTGLNDLEPIYKRMSYLPINKNIDHLSSKNSFRLDSKEKTSAERYTGFGSNTAKKKYEYFYNKTDLMMSIQGNSNMGSSQSMLILDNIKMYETDMIPFFKYFEDANIYKGIQIPYVGVAPNIDYLNSDFIFVDNITIGLDSLDNSIIDNAIICEPNIIISASSSVSVITNDVQNVTTTSATLSGNITLQGQNIIFKSGGIYLSKNNPPKDKILEIISLDNNDITQNITNLEPNTLYYYQVFSNTQIFKTINGTLQFEPIEEYSGEIKQFTTVRLPPDYSNSYSSDYSQ